MFILLIYGIIVLSVSNAGRNEKYPEPCPDVKRFGAVVAPTRFFSNDLPVHESGGIGCRTDVKSSMTKAVRYYGNY